MWIPQTKMQSLHFYKTTVLLLFSQLNVISQNPSNAFSTKCSSFYTRKCYWICIFLCSKDEFFTVKNFVVLVWTIFLCCISLNNKIVKFYSNIWSYGSTEYPNIGTGFRCLMIAATSAPKVRSNQHKNFNSVLDYVIS